MLYIISTPIGNLGDISLRATETLKNVDLILCEDTRTTKKLLDRYEIKTSTISYHQHSKLKKLEYISEQLKKGKNIALVSDAGTPTISDPGAKLVEYLLGKLPDLEAIPIPGPCAAVAALSVSGFPADKFVFLGFPPIKKKRKKFFQEIKEIKRTIVFYESPHRIIKTLKELQDTNIVVCRELTKKFEIIYRGKPERIISQLTPPARLPDGQAGGRIKGEFVIVIKGKK
ncbi:MAG: 16S rRNA (cytidine(1402)-2'-O)-methyltransferase [Candidatus Portnoybacteria bacterium]